MTMRTTGTTYVEFNLLLVDRDETLSLAGSMGISRVEAAGYIGLLVAFGLKYADDDGQVDIFSDKAIEDGCAWDGQRGELLKAFMLSGVLVGERDSSSNPIHVAPDLWAALAGKSIKARADARRRKQNQRLRAEK